MKCTVISETSGHYWCLSKGFVHGKIILQQVLKVATLNIITQVNFFSTKNRFNLKIRAGKTYKNNKWRKKKIAGFEPQIPDLESQHIVSELRTNTDHSEARNRHKTRRHNPSFCMRNVAKRTWLLNWTQGRNGWISDMGSLSPIAPHPHPHAWYQFGALLSGHPVLL